MPRLGQLVAQWRDSVEAHVQKGRPQMENGFGFYAVQRQVSSTRGKSNLSTKFQTRLSQPWEGWWVALRADTRFPEGPWSGASCVQSRQGRLEVDAALADRLSWPKSRWCSSKCWISGVKEWKGNEEREALKILPAVKLVVLRTGSLFLPL